MPGGWQPWRRRRAGVGWTGRDIVLVCHELTACSRKALIHGTTDAEDNQGPGHEVGSAARVMLALTDGMPIVAGQEHIRIDIFLRDNLP